LLPPCILIMEAESCFEKSLHIYQSTRRHMSERVIFELIIVERGIELVPAASIITEGGGKRILSNIGNNYLITQAWPK